MGSCVPNVFCQYSSQVYGESRVQVEETPSSSSSAFEFNKELIIPAYDSLAPFKYKMYSFIPEEFSYYSLPSLIVQDINQACNNKAVLARKKKVANIASKLLPWLVLQFIPELTPSSLSVGCAAHTPALLAHGLAANTASRCQVPSEATQVPGQVSLGWFILSVNFLHTGIDKNGTPLVWANSTS